MEKLLVDYVFQRVLRRLVNLGCRNFKAFKDAMNKLRRADQRKTL